MGREKSMIYGGGLNHNVTVDFVTDTIHAGVASHGLGRGCEVQWLQRQRSTVSFIMRTVSSGRSMRSDVPSSKWISQRPPKRRDARELKATMVRA